MIKIPTYYKSPHKIAGVNSKAPVLLGLSGGADSVSLLYNLLASAEDEGFEVFAAHVNHNIRLDGYNNEAARDEQFCRELCDSLGVKLFVASIDVPALAKSTGESIEGAARRARYDFFSEVMEMEGISLLVTAHNATDNFETQIFNLCRGSGISGLSGIPESRELGDGKLIVRPILSGTKAEILEFCSENSVFYVTDSTNFETDATRNKIRNLIVPELEKIFPAAQCAAARLSASASDIADYMRCQAISYLDSEAVAHDSELSFPACSFNNLHIALRREIVSCASKKLQISIEYTHIQSIITLIERAIPHSSIDLPDGYLCKIEDGYAVISNEDKPCDNSPEYEIPFDSSVIEIDSRGFCVAMGEDSIAKIDDKIYSLYTSATIKSDKIKNSLLSGRGIIRSRREGDRIIDGGNTKKIKKLMCDKKIPLKTRASIPLICLDGEIIYAPMCAICDDAKRCGEGEIQIFIYKKL